MSDPVTSAARSALEELLEVSPQVDAAVILERDGGDIVASAPVAGDGMSDRIGATCVRIVAAAERARSELGREPVSQIEVATPDGHVFVVADSTWIVAAVTDADPTVGLVFYDLKTALRSVRESRGADTGPVPSAKLESIEPLVTPVQVPSPGDEEPTFTGDDDSFEPQGANRWRRRKP